MRQKRDIKWAIPVILEESTGNFYNNRVLMNSSIDFDYSVSPPHTTLHHQSKPKKKSFPTRWSQLHGSFDVIMIHSKSLFQVFLPNSLNNVNTIKVVFSYKPTHNIFAVAVKSFTA